LVIDVAVYLSWLVSCTIGDRIDIYVFSIHDVLDMINSIMIMILINLINFL